MEQKTTTLICILAATAITPIPGSTDPVQGPVELADYADTGEGAACIAIYDSEADQYLVHGLEQCTEPLAPCSTFKIPNALIGLETGVLEGPDDRKNWDGKQHKRKVNNQDHDLASAIRNSVLWYFQDVARDVGPEKMQHYLDALDYGNRDISGGQDRFWLSSSLEITAFEQIRFMHKLDNGALPVDRHNQQTVEDMMLQDSNLPDAFRGDLYGKTGSCVGNETDHGWFTGFYHRNDRKYVFVVNVTGEKQWGWQARTIALNVLNDLP